MITCQHEWVDQCVARYRCEPPAGYHFENAHYPVSEKLGGIDTVLLWFPDHVVRGVLQTLEYNYPCMDTRRYEREVEALKVVYPEYLELYWKAYRLCKSFAAKVIAPINGKRTGEKAKETGQIAIARSYINKDNQRRAGTENLKKAHAKTRKPVEVLLPNGILLTFESMSEASSCLGIDGTCISGVAKNPGKKTKGHQARFSK
jgi:hypothetical protein